MKFIVKSFIYLIVFLVALIAFLPKQSLYNYLEQELQKNGLVISGESLEEKSFSLNITDADVYYEGINVANVRKVKLNTFILYNSLDISQVRVLKELKTFVPSPINSLNLVYSLLNPTKIEVKGDGSFGKLKAYINPFNKTIKVILEASELMKSSYGKLLMQMKKENERYVYEYKY